MTNRQARMQDEQEFQRLRVEIERTKRRRPARGEFGCWMPPGPYNHATIVVNSGTSPGR